MAGARGHFSWADTHRLVRKLFEKHAVLRAAFILHNGRLIPRYAPPGKKETIRTAYHWWAPEKGTAVTPGVQGNFHPLWTGGGFETKVLIFSRWAVFMNFMGIRPGWPARSWALNRLRGLGDFVMGAVSIGGGWAVFC